MKCNLDNLNSEDFQAKLNNYKKILSMLNSVLQYNFWNILFILSNISCIIFCYISYSHHLKFTMVLGGITSLVTMCLPVFNIYNLCYHIKWSYIDNITYIYRKLNKSDKYYESIPFNSICSYNLYIVLSFVIAIGTIISSIYYFSFLNDLVSCLSKA